MSAVAELARLLQDGDLELPPLTDDEVAALSPLLPPEARLVPLVTHAGLDEAHRAERVAAGERSLLERGLLVEGESGVAPTEELRTILAIREAPLAVTMVDVVRRSGIASCYAYGLGDPAFVLTETVEQGEHAFAVASPASVAERLAAELDPEGRAARSEGLVLERGTDFESPGWDAVERAAREAETTVSLYAVHRLANDEVVELSSSIAVAADAVWLVAGEVDLRTGEGKVTARRLSPAGIAETLRTFLALEGVRREEERAMGIEPT